MADQTGDIDSLSDAYAVYLQRQWERLAIAAASIAITLVPVFAILDYLVYPEWFESFLSLRVICALGVGAAVVLTVRFASKATKQVAIASFLVIQAMICYMIMVTDGTASGYYAGLNLPIITMGFFLPTALLETLLFCGLTVALYIWACLAAPADWVWGRFGENLFFLVSTGLIASYATWFLGVRRESEFRLSYEVEQRNLQLARMNEERARFFSNISHEFRTPLTLILAPVQDLLQSGARLPDAVAVPLSVIRDNALRLLKLVNELLEIIRLEEGKGNLESVPVELNRSVTGIVDSMVHLADSKDLRLERTLGEGTLFTRGDPRAVEKVFVNLLSNAVKFTPPGGQVRVSTERVGAVARVSVSDTGIGIGSGDQASVFERFRQADGSTTRRFRGTGLGLALVKELTERMGGAVTVQSELGVGTCMTVELPLLEGDVAEDPSVEAVPDDAIELLHRLADRRGGLSVEERDDEAVWETGPSGDGQPSVLVVEDEPDMRRYLVDVLGREYKVLQARDGLAGLRMAVEREPDLIVLDLMLPEMDGLEVCRRIRSEAGQSATRIMLLTARADEESKLTALKNGADDFLTKPFSTVEVLTRLRNLLENARLEKDLAVRNASLEKTLKDLESTQAQLIQSEKLNALGSLSAGLLHEINNPLNYSLTALQILSGDPDLQDDELKREILGDIQEGMQRIRTIVSDLRAFAYPSEADKQGSFDFNEAVDAALRFTAHDIGGIEVVRDLPCPAMISGSKSHLTQVLVNLLVNAAKAIAGVGRERPGRIRVSGGFSDGRFTVAVSDNGVGMDEATLGRIFDPFFTTRDVGEGMGLGLSICHTIIGNHQGRLAATSRPGEGSELRFDLPQAAMEEP